jgi:SAM-dependent methyltransferase
MSGSMTPLPADFTPQASGKETQPMRASTKTFNTLVAEALATDFTGWDFSWSAGRWREEEPPWDYAAIVSEKWIDVRALLDMDTGGGEMLASLAPLPEETVATERYPPNVAVAKARLEPLGVQVVPPAGKERLPFADGHFDRVINRHGDFHVPELRRVIQPGGRFITQQVGSRNCMQLNQALGDKRHGDVEYWTLAHGLETLERAGFEIERAEEAFPESSFFDIGAIVRYLTIIQWQIADFSVDRYHDALLALHEHIECEGSFMATAHRFLIEARKV